MIIIEEGYKNMNGGLCLQEGSGEKYLGFY